MQNGGVIVTEASFSAGAVISAGSVGHSRQLDHYGSQVDTTVVLSGPIGPFAEGTDLHTVLVWIIEHVGALEGDVLRVDRFTAGAFILPNVRAGAIIRKQGIAPQNIKMDAVVTSTVRMGGGLSAAAQVVATPDASFRASAWLLEQIVC